jgi:selenoprotein W-related protein
LAEQISSQFGLKAELVKGHGGVFEVSAGDRILFSKKQMGRFPEPGEIEDQLAKIVA